MAELKSTAGDGGPDPDSVQVQEDAGRPNVPALPPLTAQRCVLQRTLMPAPPPDNVLCACAAVSNVQVELECKPVWHVLPVYVFSHESRLQRQPSMLPVPVGYEQQAVVSCVVLSSVSMCVLAPPGEKLVTHVFSSCPQWHSCELER